MQRPTVQHVASCLQTAQKSRGERKPAQRHIGKQEDVSLKEEPKLQCSPLVIRPIRTPRNLRHFQRRDKVFRTKAHLTIRAYGDDIKHLCQMCHKSFCRESRLDKHITDVHEYSCRKCHILFSDGSLLERHMDDIHSQHSHRTPRSPLGNTGNSAGTEASKIPSGGETNSWRLPVPPLLLSFKWLHECMQIVQSVSGILVKDYQHRHQ